MENYSRDELIRKAVEAAGKEKERVKEEENKFERENGRKPSNKEKNEINAKLAEAVSVVCDIITGNIFISTSGRPHLKTEEIHTILKNKMLKLKKSLEKEGRPIEICAEFKACNEALHSRQDARLNDLVIATINVKDGSFKKRCRNCKFTTWGAKAFTD
ncbi:hypothetical protein [Candidatus Parabeggiatoa sp. HSG14]|uniref:hypothetical protein n=1 Tax=Candidatus Parabeggiatoa sp. HSG14 TaxID=3055593 RepID=UPI0025A92B17|nr:hypothetical protein [Thiotrichales bacterium HSG14]